MRRHECPLSRRRSQVTVALPHYPLEPPLAVVRLAGSSGLSTRTSTESHTVTDARGVNSPRVKRRRDRHATTISIQGLCSRIGPGPPMVVDFAATASCERRPETFAFPRRSDRGAQALPAGPPPAGSNHPGSAAALALDATDRYDNTASPRAARVAAGVNTCENGTCCSHGKTIRRETSISCHYITCDSKSI